MIEVAGGIVLAGVFLFALYKLYETWSYERAWDAFLGYKPRLWPWGKR